jgi:hypothetical protein
MVKPPDIEPASDIVLTITLKPATGQIALNGPLDNRLQCYGMLEMAREILTARGLPQAQQGKPSRIQVPNLGFRPPNRGRGN